MDEYAPQKAFVVCNERDGTFGWTNQDSSLGIIPRGSLGGRITYCARRNLNVATLEFSVQIRCGIVNEI